MTLLDENKHDELRAEGFDAKLWRDLLTYTKPHKRVVFALMLVAMMTGAIDAAFPMLTRDVIDTVAAQGMAADLSTLGVRYAVLVACLALCIFTFIMLAGWLRTSLSYDIREAGFAKLQELSFSYFDERPVGWLMARMTSDCDRLANILVWGVLLDMVWGTSVMVATVSAMIYLDASLALIVLMVVPLLAWISHVFQRKILKAARHVRGFNSRITASFNESVMGLRTTKAFVREDADLGEFKNLSGDMWQASVRNAVLSAAFLPLVLSLCSLAIGLGVAVGGDRALSGAMSLGTLIAFVTYASRLFDPMQEMAVVFAEMQMAQAAGERVLGLIGTEAAVRDRDDVAARIAANVPRDGLAEDGLPDRVDAIAWRDVSFGYGDGPRVLDGINLEIASGSTIALVGPTGGGKSTFVGLLSRFYEPTAGAIEVGGVEYRERSLRWWQSQFASVLQDPHLFSGTVRENIRYGKLDASDDDVEDAARTVGAHAFVEQLDDGYDTEVGEGGDRLSTGEKQLVSFARALLADPAILIMDEATSSIDTETERRIQSAIDCVLEDRTCILIAHRLSTVRRADQILVIDEGRIVERGTHRELLDHGGRYAELWGQQVSPGDSRPIGVTA